MDLMTTQEVADYLKVPAATLRYWRHQGTGPRGFRLGGKKVMFRRADVDAYLLEQINAERGPGDQLTSL